MVFKWHEANCREAANRVAVLLLLGGLPWLSGCSDSPYDLAPVKGRVTLDGKPFPWGSVMFAPMKTSIDSAKVGKPGFGMLDAEGGFVLTTYDDNDGAVVGDHRVTVFCVDDGPNGPPPSSIPAFRRMALRGTAMTVAADSDNDFEIALTSNELRKYGSNR